MGNDTSVSDFAHKLTRYLEGNQAAIQEVEAALGTRYSRGTVAEFGAYLRRRFTELASTGACTCGSSNGAHSRSCQIRSWQDAERTTHVVMDDTEEAEARAAGTFVEEYSVYKDEDEDSKEDKD